MSQQVVVLLLGSNLGDRKKNIENALFLIEESIGNIKFKSNFYETFPIEFASFKKFINFAIELNTLLSPIELLNQIKKIEKKLGREQDSRELGGFFDRLIDIDIVSYGNLNYVSKSLILPHQGHLKREFSIEILKNLNEIKHKL
jgi:2-amino-4-hydroxy-6-hydroxymethyldihydropteridine diphosphokinase